MLESLKIEHGSEAWLIFRRSGIGGSDAGAIIGQSPFKSCTRVWEEKTRKVEPEDISDNPQVKYGKNAEDVLIKIFELDYPEYTVKVDKGTVYKRNFMFASLDAELTDSNGRKGILEIKTTEIHSASSMQKWDRQIPSYYYAQIVHYLVVTGWDFAILKVQIKGTGLNGEIEHITRHYRFERKDILDDLKYLYVQELKFWRCVVTGKRPPCILPILEKN